MQGGLPIREVGMPISGGARPSVSPDITIACEVGVVPEYEVREAAVLAHIPWPVFTAMDYPDKVKVVAFQRTRKLAQAWESWAAHASLPGGRGGEA